MRKLIDRTDMISQLEAADNRLRRGIYSAEEFFQQTNPTEVKQLSLEVRRKIRDDLDDEIHADAEKGFLANAKIALDAQGRLWSCPFPLYSMTDGQTSQSHLLGITLAITDEAGAKVCVKWRDPDRNLDCGGSWAPPAAYMSVPVKDWTCRDYEPTITAWRPLIYHNIRQLFKRECGLPEDTVFQIDLESLVEVDCPRAQFEILIGIKSDLIYESLHRKSGWTSFDEATVQDVIARADRQNATAHLAAMTVAVCDDPAAAWEKIRQIK